MFSRIAIVALVFTAFAAVGADAGDGAQAESHSYALTFDVGE